MAITLYGERILRSSVNADSFASTMETMIGAKLYALRFKQQEQGATDGYVFLTSAVALWDGTYINVQPPVFYYGGASIYGMTLTTTGSDAIEQSKVEEHDSPKYLNIQLSGIGFSKLTHSGNAPAVSGLPESLVRGIALFSTLPVYPDLTTAVKKLAVMSHNSSAPYIYDNTKDTPDKMFPDLQFYRYALVKPGESLSSIVINFNALPTKPTLTMDSFVHKMEHKTMYSYNQRIFAGNTKITMQPPQIQTSKNSSITNSADSMTFFLAHITMKSGELNVGATQLFPATTDNLNPHSIVPSIVTYPDIRASTLTFYKCVRTRGTPQYGRYPYTFTYWNSPAYKMLAHNTLNLAYYFRNTGLNIFTDSEQYDINSLFTGNGTTQTGVPGWRPEIPNDSMASFTNNIPDAISNTWTETHKVRVSYINNPLSYPAAQTYATNGDVVGFCSNAAPISQGQFGQYPMVLFTTQGVYAMQIGTSDIIITSIVPLTASICTNPKSIVTNGSNIFFITQSGLKVLAGSQTNDISAPVYLGSGAVNMPPTHTTINSILTDAKICAFPPTANPAENAGLQAVLNLPATQMNIDLQTNELLVCNKNKKYVYVFSFATQSWRKEHKYASQLLQKYPILIGVEGTSLVMTTKPEDGIVFRKNVFYQSRPFMLAPAGYTKINRLIVRGYFDVRDMTNSNVFGAYLFSSLDGSTSTSWRCESWVELPPGTYNDIKFLSSRGSNKYYVIVLGGYLNSTSYISHMDVDYQPFPLSNAGLR